MKELKRIINGLSEKEYKAAAQYFGREKRQQIGQAVRYRACIQQVVRERIVVFEKLSRRDRAGHCTGFAINQVLGDKCLEPGKVIKEEYLPFGRATGGDRC